MLWFLIALLVILVLALLVRPLLRVPPTLTEDQGPTLSLFRDQLAEIDRDLERELVSTAEAEQARLEVQRRLLAASEADAKSSRSAAKPRNALASKIMVVVLATAVPLVALVVYLELGSPQLPDQPFAQRQFDQNPDAALARQMGPMIEKLKARLAESPRDVLSWVLLARSYRSLRQFQDAADAFAEARRLDPTNPELAADYGEALVFVNDGAVSELAEQAFAEALTGDPLMFKARYYLAYAKMQRQELDEALQDWVDLTALAPEGAPWLRQVNERIVDLAGRLGIDPVTLSASEEARRLAAESGDALRGPTQQQVDQAGQMTEAERRAMIDGMVAQLADRLKDNPNDLEGWQRLGRSYQVLNKLPEAAESLGKAAALAPTDKDVLLEYASALLEIEGTEEKLPPKMVKVMEQVHALDPADDTALWYLGLAARNAGDIPKARQMWQTLLQQFEPDSIPYQRIQEQIDALPQG